jgi:hypothetical protein
MAERTKNDYSLAESIAAGTTAATVEKYNHIPGGLPAARFAGNLFVVGDVAIGAIKTIGAATDNDPDTVPQFEAAKSVGSLRVDSPPISCNRPLNPFQGGLEWFLRTGW